MGSKKYYGYVINEKFLDGDEICWIDSGNGSFIIGSKDGKDYFIKKNSNISKPNRKSFSSEAAFKKNDDKVKQLERKQKDLSKLMSDLSFDEDHIAVEEDHFWDDEDNRFVTVTRYLSGAISDVLEITTKSIDVKHNIFLQMATLLKKLHKRGVIHGDLKEKNFLFKRNGEKYDVYIIDFDCSYTNDYLPNLDDGVPYSESYESPEIIAYLSSENPENSYYLTPKTDVFSLAIIIHYLFTGKFLKDEHKSMADRLLNIKDYKIPFDKSLDQIIGDNHCANYESLLNWMMVMDFDERATIDDVIDVLNDEKDVPDKFHLGKTISNFDGIWSKDGNKVNYDEARLKKNNIVKFKKTYSDGYRYEIKKNDGLTEILTIDEVIKKGYLDAKEVELDSVWPDDNIEFEPLDVLKEKKIFKVNKFSYMGKHKYEIVMTDGTSINMSAAGLVSEGIAKFIKNEYVSKFGEPWEDDSDYRYASDEECKRLEVESIEKVVVGVNHLYSVKYKGYEPKFFNTKTMTLTGLLIKKGE